MKLKLDDWQQKVLEIEGNIVLRAGRQVGKSTIIAIKAGEYAAKNPRKTILIISAVERQACLLFEKVIGYLAENYKSYIKTGVDRPTKHQCKLRNGSVIHSLPTGLTGYGIRGYTVDMLIADEAAFISEDVWQAVTPMLAITKGNLILLSTPFGREGYFYSCFDDPSYTKFHVSSLDCPRKDEKFLERERQRMTKAQFQQEYEGLFVDELQRFFPDSVIKQCAILQKTGVIDPGDKFLGVDIARLGEDETVLASVVKIKDRGMEKIRQIGMDITTKTMLTETIELIKANDSVIHYRKIYIDDGGIGAGVYDVLLRDDQTKRRVVAINNSSRPLDRDEKRKKKILKEDLYSNLLRLMESRKIELFDDTNLILSLKSIQYEYTEGNIKIFGKYSHIAEALVRAAWCVQDKHLNIWVGF